ncbi:hypothetical protein ACU4GD_45235 [Cupriavidus basilensis]
MLAQTAGDAGTLSCPGFAFGAGDRQPCEFDMQPSEDGPARGAGVSARASAGAPCSPATSTREGEEALSA